MWDEMSRLVKCTWACFLFGSWRITSVLRPAFRTDKPFVGTQQLGVSIKLLPPLHKAVEIDSLYLQKPSVDLIKNAQWGMEVFFAALFFIPLEGLPAAGTGEDVEPGPYARGDSIRTLHSDFGWHFRGRTVHSRAVSKALL